MKKYVKYFLFLIITFVPSVVLAASNNMVIINCPDTAVGETFVCEVQGFVQDMEVTSMNASYTVSSIFQVTNFRFAEGISGYYQNGAIQFDSVRGLTGQFSIGYMDLKATREGTGFLTIDNVVFSNSNTYVQLSASAARAEIKVNESKTTVEVKEVDTSGKPLLKSMYIVGYDIPFDSKARHYTIDVDYDLEEIYIMAEGVEGSYIEGAGVVKINKREDTKLEVVVKYDNYNYNTYTINVRKSYKNLIWYIITGSLALALIAVIIISYVSKNKLVESIYKDHPELKNRGKSGVLMNGQMVNASAIPMKSNNEAFRAVNTSNLLTDEEEKEVKPVVKQVKVVTTIKKEPVKENDK